MEKIFKRSKYHAFIVQDVITFNFILQHLQPSISSQNALADLFVGLD